LVQLQRGINHLKMAKRARLQDFSVEDAELRGRDNERSVREAFRAHGHDYSNSPFYNGGVPLDEIAGSLEARGRMMEYMRFSDKVRDKLDAGFYDSPWRIQEALRDTRKLEELHSSAWGYGRIGEGGRVVGRLPSDWDVKEMKSAYEGAIGHLPGPARVTIDKFLFGSTPSGKTGLETMVAHHRSKLNPAGPAMGGAGVGAAAARH
jgi:hypothetical protein